MRTLSQHELAEISGGFCQPHNVDVAMTADRLRRQYDRGEGPLAEFAPIAMALEGPGQLIDGIENPLLRWTLKSAIVAIGVAVAIAVFVVEENDDWIECF